MSTPNITDKLIKHIEEEIKRREIRGEDTEKLRNYLKEINRLKSLLVEATRRDEEKNQ